MKLFSPLTKTNLDELLRERSIYVEENGTCLDLLFEDTLLLASVEKVDFEEFLKENHNELYNQFTYIEDNEEGGRDKEFNEWFYVDCNKVALITLVCELYFDECKTKGVQVVSV